jgi:hypothetical protein
MTSSRLQALIDKGSDILRLVSQGLFLRQVSPKVSFFGGAATTLPSFLIEVSLLADCSVMGFREF